MKKTILFLAVTGIIAGTSFTACQSTEQKTKIAEDKVQNAEIKLDQAQLNLYEAQQAAHAEYLEFKRVSDEKFVANQKSIAEFKARIASEKMENRAEYEMKLAELDQKNSDLKKKLDEFKAEGKDQWDIFKTQFRQDMENMSESFKNLMHKK